MCHSRSSGFWHDAKMKAPPIKMHRVTESDIETWPGYGDGV
jgi:hypothetical protein